MKVRLVYVVRGHSAKKHTANYYSRVASFSTAGNDVVFVERYLGECWGNWVRRLRGKGFAGGMHPVLLIYHEMTSKFVVTVTFSELMVIAPVERPWGK
jgi:hypothetical protein